MKFITYILSVIVLSTIISCNKKTFPETSNCQLYNPIASIYIPDTERLVVKAIESGVIKRKDKIRLDSKDLNRVLKAIVSIHNAAKDLLAADTVFAYKIKTYGRPYLRKIGVTFRTAYGTENTWKKGDNTTENAEINKLIKRYDLRITKVKKKKRYSEAILVSGDALNMPALGREFEKIQAVWSAYYYRRYFSNRIRSDIELIEFGKDIILRFSYNWGDCAAGCIFRRYWEFKVDKNCKVEFLRSYGANNSLPTPSAPICDCPYYLPF